MRVGRVVALALPAYILFLLITAPAAKIVPLLQSRWPAVNLAGISGSVWSGRAVQAGTPVAALTDVAWDLRLLALFKGALEIDINGRLVGQPVTLRLGRSIFSGLYLHDVRGRVAAGELLRWLKLNQFAVEGQLDFALESVTWTGAAVPAVSGAVDWAPALLSNPVELNLGSAHIDAVTEDGVTTGKLKASGGALTADGDVTLQPDGSYRLVLDITRQGSIPDAVDGFLTTFGEFKDGKYRLEWSDQIRL